MKIKLFRFIALLLVPALLAGDVSAAWPSLLGGAPVVLRPACLPLVSAQALSAPASMFRHPGSFTAPVSIVVAGLAGLLAGASGVALPATDLPPIPGLAMAALSSLVLGVAAGSNPRMVYLQRRGFVLTHQSRLGELSPRYEKALYERFIQGKTQKQMAYEQGVKPNTIHVLIQNAFKDLSALVDSGTMSDRGFVRTHENRLHELKPAYERALREHYVENQKMGQMARERGVTLAAVLLMLQRAVKALKHRVASRQLSDRGVVLAHADRLDVLKPLYAQVLRDVFIEGKTLQALADERGVSREAVFLMKSRALKALKDRVASAPSRTASFLILGLGVGWLAYALAGAAGGHVSMPDLPAIPGLAMAWWTGLELSAGTLATGALTAVSFLVLGTAGASGKGRSGSRIPDALDPTRMEDVPGQEAERHPLQGLLESISPHAMRVFQTISQPAATPRGWKLAEIRKGTLLNEETLRDILIQLAVENLMRIYYENGTNYYSLSDTAKNMGQTFRSRGRPGSPAEPSTRPAPAIPRPSRILQRAA